MPEYINKSPHARAMPAYIAIFAKRGWDGKPYSVAEYWTPFITPAQAVEARTRFMGVGYGRHAILGVTDVSACVTHLPPFE